MKLAIADPPYLGVADLWYGTTITEPAAIGKSGLKGKPRKPDAHPDAHLWDNPEIHRALVQTLIDEYHGFAIAMRVDNLWQYLQWVPQKTCHVAVWTKTDTMPTGTRPLRMWEPVVIRVPEGRRRHDSRPWQQINPRDHLHHGGARSNGWHEKFAGAKPPAWTRWVLDMLGYDPEQDTVDDLFGGSGAVAAEIAQGVLL